MKKITSVSVSSLLLSTFITLAIASPVYAYTRIQTELDLGEKNSDVTSLQEFLSSTPVIYPEGIVSGYFGSLTQKAVRRFQGEHNLSQVGRVGPQTRDALNTLIDNGGSSDVSGPALYNVFQNVTQNSATFTWNTNENAASKIFYSTNYVGFNEGDINSFGFGLTSGYVASSDNLLRTNQQVTINNLQPNTTYYYILVSTDVNGNVSLYGPNNTFRTNQ